MVGIGVCCFDLLLVCIALSGISWLLFMALVPFGKGLVFGSRTGFFGIVAGKFRNFRTSVLAFDVVFLMLVIDGGESPSSRFRTSSFDSVSPLGIVNLDKIAMVSASVKVLFNFLSARIASTFLCSLESTSDTWFSMPGTCCTLASYLLSSRLKRNRIPLESLHNLRYMRLFASTLRMSSFAERRKKSKLRRAYSTERVSFFGMP